jgi:hypothetical protein
MSSSHPTDDIAAYRRIVQRILQERSDVSPSEIVELLGDYVMWGPLDPSAQEQVPAEGATDSAFAAA